MARSEKILEIFKRDGYVGYDTLRRTTRARNIPDLIYKLRGKGHRIESVWGQSVDGVRYVQGYRYYSRKAA